jgi:hypothetical protein
MGRWIIILAVFILGLASGLAIANWLEQPVFMDPAYGRISGLPEPAPKEVLAFAAVLQRYPALALDFTHLENPQVCLNDHAHMLHISTQQEAEIPFAFLHPADPLIQAGLDVSQLILEPENADELEPGHWYYYPANGRIEPLHGKPLGAPMLIWTSHTHPRPITWPAPKPSL